MSKKEKITLGGQPIGRFKASWLLFKESWRFLRADKEMVWIPLITAILNLVLFGILVTVFVMVVLGGNFTISAEGEPSSPIELAFIFLVYVVAAFTFALSQAGITHIVYTRIRGGDATLGDGLKTAFSHWGSLLLWSIITSTVGLLLRMIAERSRLLGKLVVFIIGSAWSILTYFVVPAMIIDNKSAFTSIGKSARVFKQTWGETIVSNISIGLVFFIAHVIVILATIGLVIAGVAVESTIFIFGVLGLYAIWILISGLVQSALSGVLKTLLYVYASENIVPENFNRELLEKMMSRKDGAIPPSNNPPMQSTVSVTSQEEGQVQGTRHGTI